MQLNIHCMPINMNTLSGLLITHEETILKHLQGKNVLVVLEAPCCEEIDFFFLTW